MYVCVCEYVYVYVFVIYLHISNLKSNITIFNIKLA